MLPFLKLETIPFLYDMLMFSACFINFLLPSRSVIFVLVAVLFEIEVGQLGGLVVSELLPLESLIGEQGLLAGLLR